MASMNRRSVIGGLAATAVALPSCSRTAEENPEVVAPVDDAEVGDAAAEAGQNVEEANAGLGFGDPISLGPVGEVLATIKRNRNFLYVPEARAWVVAYPAEHVEAARAVYPQQVHVGLGVGLIALYQKCPHLGCRVPNCDTSQQFECPCHGSVYTHVGEKIGGPSPRGMDIFPLVLDNGIVSIDTGQIFEGLPPDIVLTDPTPAGPRCVDVDL